MNHFGTKKIETDRLILRRFKEEDAFDIYNSFINDKKYLYYFNKKKKH